MKNVITLVITILLLVFSAGCTQSITDKIVIVGIDSFDRASIAKEIQNICALNPSVIAIDVQFPERENDQEDSVLRSALSMCSRIVLPRQIKNYTYEDKNYSDTLGCNPFFFR